MSRKINRIVIHCSATIDWDVDRLERFFYEERGWQHPGYHIVVDKNGRRHDLLPIDQIANGVKGYNSDSLHICYLGGVDENMEPKDTRTDAQKATLFVLAKNFKHTLQVPVYGHRDLSPDTDNSGEVEPDEWIKACPSFDVEEWLKEQGLCDS